MRALAHIRSEFRAGHVGRPGSITDALAREVTQ